MALLVSPAWLLATAVMVLAPGVSGTLAVQVPLVTVAGWPLTVT